MFHEQNSIVEERLVYQPYWSGFSVSSLFLKSIHVHTTQGFWAFNIAIIDSCWV